MAMSIRPQEPFLAPSILSADFARLADALAMLSRADRCIVHVDVMDGRFVPNITIGMPVVAALRRETALILDCHLMIADPARYALEFVKAGADWVSIHQEADPHCHRTLGAIRQAGAKAGIVLNPGTPVEALTDLVGTFDYALLMSVNPGFGGQSFIPRVLDKVRRLDAMRRSAVPDPGGRRGRPRQRDRPGGGGRGCAGGGQRGVQRRRPAPGHRRAAGGHGRGGGRPPPEESIVILRYKT